MYVLSLVATTRKPKPASRRPDQLPAGRHGLDRDFVVENQLERIRAGVMETSATMGYAKASVEDIVKAAGVSRRTFYDHFPNKDAAFLAAYDSVTERLLTELSTAYAGAESFAEGVQDCLEAFLSFVAAEPLSAQMCIVEVLAAGPAALERRNQTMGAIAHMFDTGAKREKGILKAPPLVSETVVGGIYEVVYARVLRKEFDELPDLLPDFAYSALLPYVGAEKAQAEYRRLRRRRQRISRAAAGR